MKVVIADDEEHVRKGIDLAVDWEHFGISERLMAEDGIQAIELVRQHRPAILFCDMSMPQMNGIELLELLREEGWDTKIIVVSGYDDYSYTRAALLANGVDYILKPFKTKDLEKAVARAVAAYREAQSKTKDEIESRHRLHLADSLLDEQRWGEYLRGEVVLQDHPLHQLFHRTGLPLQNLRVSCILPRNKYRLMNKKFAGDVGLFQFAVSNIAHDILKAYGVHYLCRLDEYQWVILMSPSQPEKMAIEYGWYLDKLRRAWQETLGLEVLQGACASETDYSQLLPSIAEARATLLKRELLPAGTFPVSGEAPRFTDREIPLMNAIRKGNKPVLTDIIETFVQSMKSRGSLRLEELQVNTMEANLLLKRAQSLCQTEKERPGALLSLWISDLEEWKTQLLHRCWELTESLGSDQSFGMEAVRRYMEQRYQESISLTTLSEAFHFSPRYLAKMFKDQYHMTIMTYLTELRMEKAKSLLIHSDMAISELANSIGYEDENYFGKVFKKQTGISPLQYRKQSKNR